ncbi:PR5-like receptor kinase [Corylus avellana]|uniref:PR5-like receptor kinase n=1 Tax=Corylus avellana TaxID=13451 RepID=UPI00286C8D32|nr:PR5-like receptor kinase [Corylus avellana]
MGSSRPSSPHMFMFMFISFMFMSIQACFCGGNERYVNCNRPFLRANTHRTLRFTVLPPQSSMMPFAESPEAGDSSKGYYTRGVPSSRPNPPVFSQPTSSPPAPQPNIVPSLSQPTSSSPASQSIVPSGVPDFPQSLSQAPQPIGPSRDLGVRDPYPSKSNLWLKITIGISAAVAAIVVNFCFIIYCVKRGHFSSNAMVCCNSGAEKFQIIDEEIMKNCGSIAPKRYTYSDVKKLTNSFKDKVGQGGYGVVYKGKLPDGRMVAVKVLNKSKGNGEEFINEVASISRTSHVNIVTLLGYCYERTKRALIYEFMPNGSLDKFIYDKGSPITNCHLDSKTMFQIAVGIARGLEYLHRGCNTRILHFDIKPHNILLDEDLRPKISDFGLAKRCKTKESIVLLTGMRGTAGFIAPEVFSRNFGGVSHKSDVYSYGMLVLEMVGGRKNFDGGLSHTSEIYFPHWIYMKLEQDINSATFREVIEEEVEETTKKMIIVSLWCIQTNPSDRPSIGKVIEMLEGTLQSLPFPPKPFLDSPTRSP